MKNYFIYITILMVSVLICSCGRKDSDNKSNIQILADKERELNDREARIKLKEIELEERERKLGITGNVSTGDTTKIADTTGTKKEKSDKKKEIQKEMSRKFENPVNAVKDYFEYIQRAVNETGNFDSNMSKAHKLFPSRSSEKLKNSYRRTKQFVILEDPKVVNQKDNKSTVTAKIKQIELINKDGKDQEVSKTLTVTYSLDANSMGQWLISSAEVKVE